MFCKQFYTDPRLDVHIGPGEWSKTRHRVGRLEQKQIEPTARYNLGPTERVSRRTHFAGGQLSISTAPGNTDIIRLSVRACYHDHYRPQAASRNMRQRLVGWPPSFEKVTNNVSTDYDNTQVGQPPSCHDTLIILLSRVWSLDQLLRLRRLANVAVHTTHSSTAHYSTQYTVKCIVIIVPTRNATAAAAARKTATLVFHRLLQHTVTVDCNINISSNRTHAKTIFSKQMPLLY